MTEGKWRRQIFFSLSNFFNWFPVCCLPAGYARFLALFFMFVFTSKERAMFVTSVATGPVVRWGIGSVTSSRAPAKGCDSYHEDYHATLSWPRRAPLQEGYTNLVRVELASSQAVAMHHSEVELCEAVLVLLPINLWAEAWDSLVPEVSVARLGQVCQKEKTNAVNTRHYHAGRWSRNCIHTAFADTYLFQGWQVITSTNMATVSARASEQKGRFGWLIILCLRCSAFLRN